MFKCATKGLWVASFGLLSLIASNSAAHADGLGVFDPTPLTNSLPNYSESSDLTGLFVGPYVGVDLSLQANNFNTFFSTEDKHRLAVGAIAGYNFALNDMTIVGVEARAQGAFEPSASSTSFGHNFYALSHLGFLTAKDLAIYNSVGVGLIDNELAWVYGVGVEQAVRDNFHVRIESTSFGQISGQHRGTFYGGFTAVEFTASLIWQLDYASADSGVHISWFEEPPTDFVGTYAGLAYGGLINPDYSILTVDPLKGAHMSHFAGDMMAGHNWEVNEAIRLGFEAQGGIHYDTSGTIDLQGQGLAKVGVIPMDGVMLYASGGAGIARGTPIYAIGGGVEAALWGNNTARFDIHAVGKISDAGFEPASTTKFTVGALWYLD